MAVANTVDAKKSPITEQDALALALQVDEIYAAKGKSVVHCQIRKDTDLSTLKSLLLGPTGNLRAPTIRLGRTLIVGFDEQTYKKVCGGK